MEQASSHATCIENVLESRPGHLNSTPVDLRSSEDLSIATEGHLLGDSPSIRRHRRTFGVFKDINNHITGANPNGFRQKHNPYDGDSQSRGPGCKASALFEDESVAHSNWYHQLRPYPKTPIHSTNSDNLPPGLEYQSQRGPVEDPPKRVTQRYFSVAGNEEPHFFDAMPPQMEFGGMAGPKYHGATLNPLNPHFRRSHL